MPVANPVLHSEEREVLFTSSVATAVLTGTSGLTA